MDKNQAMISFLQTCETISANPLFFNFGNVENDAHQVVIKSNDTALQQPYIDGSVLKRFTCAIDSFKSVAYVPMSTGYVDENMEDMQEVQSILDWIEKQADEFNFPNFGEECVVDSMKVLTDKPQLVGVDTELNPPTAVYRISVQVDYIDKSKCIWK